MKKKISLSLILLTGITLSACSDSKGETKDQDVLYQRSVSDLNNSPSNQPSPINDSLAKIRNALNSAYNDDNKPQAEAAPQAQAQPFENTIPDIAGTSAKNVPAPQNNTDESGKLKIDTTVGLLNNKNKQPVTELAQDESRQEEPAISANNIVQENTQDEHLAPVEIKPDTAQEETTPQNQEVEAAAPVESAPAETAPDANLDTSPVPENSKAEVSTISSNEQQTEQVKPAPKNEAAAPAKKATVSLAKVNNNSSKLKKELGMPASFIYKQKAEYNVTENTQPALKTPTPAASTAEDIDAVVYNPEKTTKPLVRKTNINQGAVKNSSVLKNEFSDKKPAYTVQNNSAPARKDISEVSPAYIDNQSTKPVEVVEKNEKIERTERVEKNSSDVLPPPENAKSGECYGKVTSKGETKELEEDIIVTPERTETMTSPAEYKEVEEEVVVKEASTKLIDIPASYKEVEEKVLVSPAEKTWEKTGGTIEKDGEVLKLVEKPAVYKTVKTKVLDQAAHQEKIDVMPITKKIKKQVLVKDATNEEVKIPAVTKKVKHTVSVTPDKIEWMPVICNEGLNHATVKQIQGALIGRGYKLDKADGVIGARTRKAIENYQDSIGLNSPGIALKTLDSLGVKY